MTESETFESLKRKIDDLNVKKMASESESKRLEEELNECKKEIKEVYGVEIEDFASAIEEMKKQYSLKLNELKELVLEAEQKIGE